MRVIFLDVDGVLNRHDFDAESQSNTICRECVGPFNRLIKTTGAKVVLSSAWRYMIHGDAITPKGFEYLLRTHGVTAEIAIIGATCRDESTPMRGQQIRWFLSSYPNLKLDATRIGQSDPITAYVVLDDMDTLGIAEAGHPFIRTDPGVGLTEADADRAIEILKGGEA